MTDVNEGMVLRGRGLDKWYGAKHDRRQALFGVDADVRAGECLAVIGGSGSGKNAALLPAPYAIAQNSECDRMLL